MLLLIPRSFNARSVFISFVSAKDRVLTTSLFCSYYLRSIVLSVMTPQQQLGYGKREEERNEFSLHTILPTSSRFTPCCSPKFQSRCNAISMNLSHLIRIKPVPSGPTCWNSSPSCFTKTTARKKLSSEKPAGASLPKVLEAAEANVS